MVTADNVGEWARAQRRRRKWTQEEAAEALANATGQTVSRVWLSHIENGQLPSAPLLRALEKLYDSEAPQPDDPVEVLRAQALAFNRLADEIGALVQRIDLLLAGLLASGATQARADVVEFLESLSAEPSSDPPRPTVAPRRTARTRG